MGDLTLDFSRSEFVCKGDHCCGHSAPISMVLVRGLQQLRDDASALKGHDIRIHVKEHSGFRCITHDLEEAEKRWREAKERGENVPDLAIVLASRDSRHPKGIAVDCHADEFSPEELAALAEGVSAFRHSGIGIYPWGCHFDIREDGQARWNG